LSDGPAMLERMFDTRLHEDWEPPQTEGSRALIDRMCAAGRAESRAAAARLDAIGELFELHRGQRGEAADWAVDTWAAVGAEVAAAFRISQAMAGPATCAMRWRCVRGYRRWPRCCGPATSTTGCLPRWCIAAT